MERSLETQVSQAVDAWLRWLPRWQPATHRGRIAPCRRCIGSPVLSAVGLGSDVPHGVQHGLSTRMKAIVDAAVAEYTSRNLPMLQAELDQQAARNRARTYRPSEGLEPEFDGLPLDPEPVAGAPFLFTISGLAQESDDAVPELPPLSSEAKAALRQEVGLADDYANMIGREPLGRAVAPSPVACGLLVELGLQHRQVPRGVLGDGGIHDRLHPRRQTVLHPVRHVRPQSHRRQHGRADASTTGSDPASVGRRLPARQPAQPGIHRLADLGLERPLHGAIVADPGR